jgi:NCAIR mutase (PurE)-related protein
MTTAGDPFADFLAALDEGDDDARGHVARVDPARRRRTGIPEVVYADAKDDELLLDACRQLLAQVPRVVVSRLDDARGRWLAGAAGDGVDLEHPFPGRTIVLASHGSRPPRALGFVAVLTAGTSDLSAAGEAATVVREVGCRVEIVADVGVAGLHRLVRPLRRVMRDGADAIIVAAGMDGALPSVVSGLVDVPVIGLPTSVGYGVAAGGTAALMTMLATCAPGMSVVNIDNGVGAGATAALIARRAHRQD